MKNNKTVKKNNINVEDHLDLVWMIYHKNKPKLPNYEPGDWFQIGCIGLITATNTYDESSEFKFSTYATQCIQNAMFGELRSYQWDKRRITFVQDSLDREVLTSSGDTVQLYETVVDNSSDFEELIDNTELLSSIEKYVGTLQWNYPLVYKGIKDGKTQRDIAKELGITPQSISKTWRKLCAKIRKEIAY